MPNSAMPASRANAATDTAPTAPLAPIELGRQVWTLNEARKVPLSDRRLANLFGVTEMTILGATLAYLGTLTPAAPASRSYWSVSLRRWVDRDPARGTDVARLSTLQAVAA